MNDKEKETKPTQAHQELRIHTALGDDALLLVSFRYAEELGRPFRLDAVVEAARPGLKPEDLIGTPATLTIVRHDGQPRFINGVVCRVAQPAEARANLVYDLTIHPLLYLLSRTSDCRIFQPSDDALTKPVTPLSIVKDVLEEHRIDVEDRTRGTYPETRFTVQYRETDLNFISRLMEKYGIYYFFRHENGRHVMVLVDEIAQHDPLDGHGELIYHHGARMIQGTIHDWRVESEIQTETVALNDFDMFAPAKDLRVSKELATRRVDKASELYDYPGEYYETGVGENLARTRAEELGAHGKIYIARTDARGITAGGTFTLKDPTQALRTDGKKSFLVVATAVEASVAGHSSHAQRPTHFACTFRCISTDRPFRPARITPRPIVTGPQTAIVVGPNDEEIHTDELGRVKVRFHWDRYHEADDRASCWVRVSQAWAGKNWGAMFLPRVGHEVVVEFLEGDPDRPIITGRVYNNDHKPPYELPAHKTVSTIKSLSTKKGGGGGGFNELRFEDSKDSEQVFLHAQRRMDLRVRANLYETVGGNREERVGNKDKGDHNIFVCGDTNDHRKGGEYYKTEKVVNHTVLDDVVEDLQKNQTVKVAERLTLNAKEIVQEAQQTLSLKGNTVTAQGAQALNLKAGSVFVEGTQAVHLKVGGNFVVIDAAGVSINGTKVGINSGGAAQGAGSPLSATDPTIEEPIEAASATTALPGQKGRGKGSKRTRTRRTVPLLRAPDPPPPVTPGTTAFGPATADEVELVEVVEVIGRAGTTDPTAPVQTRRQYVNLPREAGGARMGAHRGAIREHGRIIYLKARIRWRDSSKTASLAGQSVRFYAQPTGASQKDPAQLHADLRAGFDRPNGGMNKTVQTDAQGWTPVVQFHTSRYGGDKFHLYATLLSSDSGGLDAGEYEVWRKIHFEVDTMKRPSGVDYMDVVSGVINDFVAAHARAFTEAIQVPRNSSPAHQRLLNYSDLTTLHTNTADSSGDQYIHLMYVDTVLTGDRQEFEAAYGGITVPAGTTPVRLALDALDANFLPTDSDWVVSASWTDPTSGASGTIPRNKITIPAPTGEYARHRNQGGNFDRWIFFVGLDGTGAPTGSRVNINIRYRSRDDLSGVQIGQTTTVAMRFRETRANGGELGLANATLQTSIHESSHAFGLASRQLPSGVANPNFITNGGGHCNFTATCVMTPALHDHTAFCDRCLDCLRARNLARINVQPGDAMP